MCKRVVVLLLVLGLTSVLYAQTTWTGGGDGTNWGDASNWDSGLPSSGQTCIIDTSGASVDLNIDATIAGQGRVEGGAELNIAGKTLSMNDTMWLGQWGGTGTLNISSGTLEVTDGYGNLILGQGYGSDDRGEVYQTGGLVSCSYTLHIYAHDSEYHLSGGVCDTTYIVFSSNSFMDISGTGELHLAGDQTATARFYIDSGQITGENVTTYYDAGLGKTIVKIQEPGQRADTIWTGAGADDLWDNPANWDNDEPNASKTWGVDVNGAIILIDSTVTAVGNLGKIGDSAGRTCGIEMTGGSLVMYDTLVLGDWGNGILDLSGGVIDITAGDANLVLGQEPGSYGQIDMSGGEINIDNTVSVTNGKINLYSGAINTEYLDIYPGQLVDIWAGTLTLSYDQRIDVNSYISGGRITAYNGNGDIVVSFDSIDTIVTAVQYADSTKWTGWGGANNSWDNPVNWSNGVPDETKKWSLDIDSGLTLFDSSMSAQTLGGIIGERNGNTAQMQMTGGSLGITYSNGNLVLGQQSGSYGTLDMTGGVLDALDTIYITHGRLDLHGGIIGANSLDVSAGQELDVIDGAMVLDGNQVPLIQTYADDKRITAKEGMRELLFGYDGIHTHIFADSNDSIREVAVTAVDDVIAVLATFQSHNQKVVSNDNGIFVTYVHEAHVSGDNNRWRMARSTDNGQSWTIIYEAIYACAAPAVETDENNNVYLIHPDWDDGSQPLYFYRFSPSNNYTTPYIKVNYSNPCASKHAMVYDNSRQQFHIFLQYGNFLTLDMNGDVVRKIQLLNSYNGIEPQYPHIQLDEDYNIHIADTTNTTYYSILHMMSRDGGLSWERMDGTPISVPARCDPCGPTQLISLPDEFNISTWLTNMLPKNGKLHFCYNAGSFTTNERTHYMRYDIDTGVREIDTWIDNPNAQWQGENITLLPYSAFFVTDPTDPNSPLYAVSGSLGMYISCLVSFDNGSNWNDFGRSASPHSWYAIGGFRNLTVDGSIIGAFTSDSPLMLPYRVKFIKIPIGDLSNYKGYYSHSVVSPVPCDFDKSGRVDFKDFAMFGQSLNSSPGSLNWNPLCDVSESNPSVIDYRDLSVFSSHWLEE